MSQEFQAIYDEIAALHEKHAELQGRLERMHRPGTVTDVDYSDGTKPRVRLRIGTDDQGQPVKSPWIAHAQHAGDRKIHAPVSVGQSMMLIAPAGTFEQGLLVNYGFSKPNESPSTDKDTHVDTFGKVTDTLTQSEWKKQVGDSTIDVTGDTITLTASKIVLVGKVYLGSADASRALALKGSIDSAGDVEQSNLATKVFGT